VMKRTHFHAGAGGSNAIGVDGFDDVVDAFACVLSKSEVVVGAQVDGGNLFAGVGEVAIDAVVKNATHRLEHRAGTATDGPIPTIPDPSKHVAHVKVLFLLQQGRFTLTWR